MPGTRLRQGFAVAQSARLAEGGKAGHDELSGIKLVQAAFAVSAGAVSIARM
jgi:hypothetical protein